MKEVAQQILNSPFNWTGLTLRELVEAGRIPTENLNQIFKEKAVSYLNLLFSGIDPMKIDIEDYMERKNNLIEELKAQFSANN